MTKTPYRKNHCLSPTCGCHCWTCGPDDTDGMSTTCILATGHDGPHEWARDDTINIAFTTRPDLPAQPLDQLIAATIAITKPELLK